MDYGNALLKLSYRCEILEIDVYFLFLKKSFQILFTHRPNRKVPLNRIVQDAFQNIEPDEGISLEEFIQAMDRQNAAPVLSHPDLGTDEHLQGHAFSSNDLFLFLMYKIQFFICLASPFIERLTLVCFCITWKKGGDEQILVRVI